MSCFHHIISKNYNVLRNLQKKIQKSLCISFVDQVYKLMFCFMVYLVYVNSWELQWRLVSKYASVYGSRRCNGDSGRYECATPNRWFTVKAISSETVNFHMISWFTYLCNYKTRITLHLLIKTGVSSGVWLMMTLGTDTCKEKFRNKEIPKYLRSLWLSIWLHSLLMSWKRIDRSRNDCSVFF